MEVESIGQLPPYRTLLKKLLATCGHAIATKPLISDKVALGYAAGHNVAAWMNKTLVIANCRQGANAYSTGTSAEIAVCWPVPRKPPHYWDHVPIALVVNEVDGDSVFVPYGFRLPASRPETAQRALNRVVAWATRIPKQAWHKPIPRAVSRYVPRAVTTGADPTWWFLHFRRPSKGEPTVRPGHGTSDPNNGKALRWDIVTPRYAEQWEPCHYARLQAANLQRDLDRMAGNTSFTVLPVLRKLTWDERRAKWPGVNTTWSFTGGLQVFHGPHLLTETRWVYDLRSGAQARDELRAEAMNALMIRGPLT